MPFKTITFTSTLSSNLMDWITEHASNIQKTKRVVLEEAIKHYKHEIKRRKMAESFKRAAEDSEMPELAEWGMNDYCRQLKKYL